MQEIEEQLCKLDSDKCVVEVCFYILALWVETQLHTFFQRFNMVLHKSGSILGGLMHLCFPHRTGCVS